MGVNEGNLASNNGGGIYAIDSNIDIIIDINRSIIFIGGSATTIANNTAAPIRSGFDNSSIVVQNSIIQQNSTRPLIGSTIPFISLCNNSQTMIKGHLR